MLDPDAPGETSDQDGGDGGGDVLMLMAVKESAATMVVTLLFHVFQVWKRSVENRMKNALPEFDLFTLPQEKFQRSMVRGFPWTRRNFLLNWSEYTTESLGKKFYKAINMVRILN